MAGAPAWARGFQLLFAHRPRPGSPSSWRPGRFRSRRDGCARGDRGDSAGAGVASPWGDEAANLAGPGRHFPSGPRAARLR